MSKSFLKWAGGKRWLAENLKHLELPPIQKYIEPFLGGGSMYFHFKPKEAILNDLNPDLIDCYNAIRSCPNEVLTKLRAHSRNHSDDYYYQLRSSKPKTLPSRAAKFIYLNRTCFNGLYRVNLNGVFNVPRGTKDSVLFPDDDFRAVSESLRSSKLMSVDFSECLKLADAHDFVYVDPPYTANHNNNGFLKYNEKIFSWSDQERLANLLSRLSRKGAMLLISNANHPSVRQLYDSSEFTIREVSRSSVISGKSSSRGKTTELLINSNFDLA